MQERKKYLEQIIISFLLESNSAINHARVYKIRSEHFDNQILSMVYDTCLLFSKQGISRDKFSILDHLHTKKGLNVHNLKIDSESKKIDLDSALREFIHLYKIKVLNKWILSNDINPSNSISLKSN